MTPEPVCLQWIAEKLVELSRTTPDFSFTPYSKDSPCQRDDFGQTWAFVLNTHRDAEPKDKRAFYAAERRLKKKHGGQNIIDARCAHWAVGWVDQILARMLDAEGKITPTGIDVAHELVKKHKDRCASIEDLAWSMEITAGPLEYPLHVPASISPVPA